MAFDTEDNDLPSLAKQAIEEKRDEMRVQSPEEVIEQRRNENREQIATDEQPLSNARISDVNMKIEAANKLAAKYNLPKIDAITDNPNAPGVNPGDLEAKIQAAEGQIRDVEAKDLQEQLGGALMGGATAVALLSDSESLGAILQSGAALHGMDVKGGQHLEPVSLSTPETNHGLVAAAQGIAREQAQGPVRTLAT